MKEAKGQKKKSKGKKTKKFYEKWSDQGAGTLSFIFNFTFSSGVTPPMTRSASSDSELRYVI